MSAFTIPNLGTSSSDSGLISLRTCSDGLHQVGQNGVVSVTATGDGKVEFIAFAGHSLAYVKSALGYPAYYPVYPVALQKPVKAVLMDLDGTSVRSEAFWIWIIQLTLATLLDNTTFELEASDLPHVSGHSVSEHLQYCLQKYCPNKSVEQARQIYFEHTHREMAEIMAGRGRVDAFTPSPGLKEFLLWLKAEKIKIGLVTSGLYEKAYPEILSAFQKMGLGNPTEFYDVIITAGLAFGASEGGGGITVIPNISVIIQIANFLVLIWVLNIILYRPIRKIIQQRKEKVQSFETTIETYNSDIQEKDEAFTTGLKAARAKGLNQKDALLQEGIDEEKKLIENVNANAQAELSEVREKIVRDVEATRASLQEKIDEFADDITQKILGRTV